MLSVAVCTKRIGLAVFCKTELLYFAVKTLKRRRSIRATQGQISQIFRETVEEFKPQIIILKLLGKQQIRSKNLQLALRLIKREAEAAGISVEEISFDEAKFTLCAGKKPTKANAFKVLSEAHPELRRLVNFQNPSQAEYYNSLLSAVLIGLHFQSKN